MTKLSGEMFWAEGTAYAQAWGSIKEGSFKEVKQVTEVGGKSPRRKEI